MAYQIYAISDSFNKNGSFFLRTHIINSSSKEASQRIFPITKIPKLSMGTQYKEDSTINCELDDSNSVDIMFEKFNEGKIVCLKDLPSISNAFLPDQDSLVNAKYYLVKSENSTYAFPCYELFRTFFCVDNRIINHLFQYDQLESFIDNDYGGVKKTKKGYELVLDLNEAYPRSLLGKKAIEKFVLILYNPEFRSLWKSIQRQMRGDTYDFSFLSMSFKRIDLQLKTKNIDSIQLVYFISAILSKISFPARSVIINHPLLKKHKGSNSKSYINESEKNRASYKIPISKDNEESQGPSNNTFEEVSVLKLEYSFDKEITIQKNKLNNDDDKDGEPNPFAYFSIEDKLLSLNQEKDAKGDRFMALTRDHIENKFDQAQIPRGLVFFTKVVEMFTSKLSINFSYNVFEFEGDYSFHMIAGEKRKGIIVELGNAEPVYIIEVDSSDDRYISTLLLTNLRTKKINSLLGLILSELSKSQGTWSKNTLDVYSDYKIVRHPRRSKEFTKQSVNESGDTNPYIKRFANRLIGLLT